MDTGVRGYDDKYIVQKLAKFFRASIAALHNLLHAR